MYELLGQHWFSLVSLLLNVMLAVVLYLKSRRTKEPRFAMRSNKLLGDPTSRLEALEVRYAGQRITNLTITRVAFWNNGKATIHGQDIAAADPLLLKMRGDCTVLDLQLLSVTNPVNQFTAKMTPDSSGVAVSFDYLDRGEGGIVQILHTGRSSLDLTLAGTIKGAGKPHRHKVAWGYGDFQNPLFVILIIIFLAFSSLVLSSEPTLKPSAFSYFFTTLLCLLVAGSIRVCRLSSTRESVA